MIPPPMFPKILRFWGPFKGFLASRLIFEMKMRKYTGLKIFHFWAHLRRFSES
jgi:hypothetical protein